VWTELIKSAARRRKGLYGLADNYFDSLAITEHYARLERSVVMFYDD
jgi:hypothetical protein